VSYDVSALRDRFPALKAGFAHFDGPGGSQVPDVVAEAVAAALTAPLANRGVVTEAERAADAIVLDARSAMADLLGAVPDGIVFGRSMTALTFDMARTLASTWGPGDEVVVTRLDHDANIRPWVLAAKAVGATVRWAEFDPATAELTEDDVAAVLSTRTRMVAITAASNLLGTRPPVRAVADLAHAAGALVYVDGVHHTAHAPVHLEALGADLYACSPYKFLGPHCGVVAGDPALLETLRPAKLAPSTDRVPERFELGTLPYEQLAGVTAAVDFIAGIAPGDGRTRRERIVASMDAVAAHEDSLLQLVEEGLASLGDAVTVHSRAAHRTPTLYLTLPGRRTWDAYEHLASLDVLAPAGSFYALEAFRALRLDDEHGLRVGLAPYSEAAEVHRLIDGLSGFLLG
jgi:cysteine desulfurase family protein (TIGR01976 family)